MSDLLNRLLPSLAAPSAAEFNVFDVMRHGTHEKQLSNVFAWLLDVGGSHRLGDRFLRCFIDQVNQDLERRGKPLVELEPFVVEQEKNTRSTRLGADIADIILQGRRTAIVIENYYISDGHGHNYGAYRDYGEKFACRSVVVLLCAFQDDSLLNRDWEEATVVTYADLITRLFDEIGSDAVYRSQNPDQYAFLIQMKRHFLKGKQVNDDSSLEFIRAMCDTGEAKRYGIRNGTTSFAEFLRVEAERTFDESRELLNRVKKTLQQYLHSNLAELNSAIGRPLFEDTNIGFQGIYQWDVSLMSGGERTVFVMFGPSAWADNEQDIYHSWDIKITEPDYSRLVIGNHKRRELRQSSVSMSDILTGLESDDSRLLDEIADAVRDAPSL